MIEHGIAVGIPIDNIMVCSLESASGSLGYMYIVHVVHVPFSVISCNYTNVFLWYAFVFHLYLHLYDIMYVHV